VESALGYSTPWVGDRFSAGESERRYSRFLVRRRQQYRKGQGVKEGG
jgi:hypothetical protein